MKRKLVVLTGMASSGKSTLGQNIQDQSKSIRFFPEIGRELRESVACTTLEFCPVFDELIMYRELHRDEEVLSLPIQLVPLVETWHIGNLSYAKLRAHCVYQNYLKRFKRQLQKFEVLALLLEIDTAAFEQRRTDPILEGHESEHTQFYLNIYKGIQEIVQHFNIPFRVIDGTQAIGLISQQVLDIIKKFVAK